MRGHKGLFFTVVFKLTNQFHQFKFTPSEYQLAFKLDQNFIIIQTRNPKTEKEILGFELTRGVLLCVIVGYEGYIC